MDFAHRIRLARRRAGLTQAQLADQVGIRRNAVSHWESALSKSPTPARLQLVSIVTGVSFEWLATGRGEMQIDPELLQSSVAASTGTLIDDPLEVRLVRAFRAAPSRVRPPLVEIVEAFAAQHGARRKSNR